MFTWVERVNDDVCFGCDGDRCLFMNQFASFVDSFVCAQMCCCRTEAEAIARWRREHTEEHVPCAGFDWHFLLSF